ncbi:TerB family tellurite resistance protein [Aureispira sp. CCB-E]|uniref:TerB family tellurite resistance protein n=1 Tax=Aureispira sp. CCB-E TaxID=3051121 RepID=UPI002869642D|nr:TerB family tellurite resistance protein [Aureispira sp. CCB-E]WMX16517.1 TerB family tellurite resistance protein [Aureispira sp. CCB-E]
MEKLSFENLLLKTAFCCMACDGDIDQKEVEYIKALSNGTKVFGEGNVTERMNSLREEINNDGHQFLRSFFIELNGASLSEEEEMKVVEVAIDTIKADNEIEYSEVKFFKIIRSKLNISNDKILADHPDFEEYLEQDIISTSYLLKLQDSYFNSQALPKFEPIQAIDEKTLKDLENNKGE